MSDRLSELVAELEAAAERLRGGDLGGEEAAELVDRCAELAARVGAELDSESRAAAAGEAGEGQERLL
jgi:hypothetical protein